MTMSDAELQSKIQFLKERLVAYLPDNVLEYGTFIQPPPHIRCTKKSLKDFVYNHPAYLPSQYQIKERDDSTSPSSNSVSAKTASRLPKAGISKSSSTGSLRNTKPSVSSSDASSLDVSESQQPVAKSISQNPTKPNISSSLTNSKNKDSTKSSVLNSTHSSKKPSSSSSKRTLTEPSGTGSKDVVPAISSITIPTMPVIPSKISPTLPSIKHSPLGKINSSPTDIHDLKRHVESLTFLPQSKLIPPPSEILACKDGTESSDDDWNINDKLSTHSADSEGVNGDIFMSSKLRTSARNRSAGARLSRSSKTSVSSETDKRIVRMKLSKDVRVVKMKLSDKSNKEIDSLKSKATLKGEVKIRKNESATESDVSNLQGPVDMELDEKAADGLESRKIISVKEESPKKPPEKENKKISAVNNVDSKVKAEEKKQDDSRQDTTNAHGSKIPNLEGKKVSQNPNLSELKEREKEVTEKRNSGNETENLGKQEAQTKQEPTPLSAVNADNPPDIVTKASNDIEEEGELAPSGANSPVSEMSGQLDKRKSSPRESRSSRRSRSRSPVRKKGSSRERKKSRVGDTGKESSSRDGEKGKEKHDDRRERDGSKSRGDRSSYKDRNRRQVSRRRLNSSRRRSSSRDSSRESSRRRRRDSERSHYRDKKKRRRDETESDSDSSHSSSSESSSKRRRRRYRSTERRSRSKDLEREKSKKDRIRKTSHLSAVNRDDDKSSDVRVSTPDSRASLGSPHPMPLASREFRYAIAMPKSDFDARKNLAHDTAKNCKDLWKSNGDNAKEQTSETPERLKCLKVYYAFLSIPYFLEEYTYVSKMQPSQRVSCDWNKLREYVTSVRFAIAKLTKPKVRPLVGYW
ncbi:hypothetical protein BKA69DRAFT_1059484 [Paraphysoderma sedebokerense]|nr:hypothetical protein BKA69DRAFT_1059484 [Paraphysoderma sedebokerense]